MSLPPIIATTAEGRRIYPIELTVNNKRLFRLIIDPHFELKHGDYINDELIWKLVQQLNNRVFFPDPPKRPSAWQYFTVDDIFYQDKIYCLVWCWKRDNPNYIGIVNCY